MIRYETLLITIPDLSKDQSEKIQKSLEKAVKDSGGNVVSYERWGKYLLAYPINKNDYGVYFLMRFEVAEEKSEELAKAFKQIFAVTLHDVVVRDMTTKLDADDSLEYRRPDSLEEAPRTPARGRSDRSGDRRFAKTSDKKEELEKAEKQTEEKPEVQVSAEVVQEEKIKEEDTQE